MIFLSYRRVDARGWARGIYESLCHVFGSSAVFMDVDGLSILLGDDFPLRIRDALDRCTVLLVLIGPDWTRLRRKGRRRIDCDDDWVRSEVAQGLRGNALVIPVLLGDAKHPAGDQLPEDLSALSHRESVALRDRCWHQDLDQLIERVAQRVPPDAVGEAALGVRHWCRLARLHPDLLQAIGAWREVIEDIALQLTQLRARKSIHDSLHRLEDLCLKPLSAAPGTLHLGQLAADLQGARAHIERELDGSGLPLQVKDTVRHRLADSSDALAALMALPEGQDRVQPAQHAVEALVQALSWSLSFVNVFIDDSAQRLRLIRFIEILDRFQSRLDGDTFAADRLRLQRSARTFQELSLELDWRIAGHGILQEIDDHLRAVIDGRASLGAGDAGGPPSEWTSVRRVLTDLAQSSDPAKRGVRDAMAARPDEPTRQVCERLAAIDGRMREPSISRADAVGLIEQVFPWTTERFNEADLRLRQICERMADLGGSFSDALDRLGDAT